MSSLPLNQKGSPYYMLQTCTKILRFCFNGSLHFLPVLHFSDSPCFSGSPFPGGPVVRTLCSQCRRPGFDTWLGGWIPHGATKAWWSQKISKNIKKINQEGCRTTRLQEAPFSMSDWRVWGCWGWQAARTWVLVSPEMVGFPAPIR